MCGAHQVSNAIAALAALCVMEERGDISLEREALYAGFKEARQPGRLECLAEGLLIDGAHNEDGARALEEAAKRYLPGKKILMVTGILADKDVEQVLDHFLQITKDFIATQPENPRKLPAAELAEKIRAMGANAEAVADPQAACRRAFERREDYDVVLAAGSLYLIGAVRSKLQALWKG